MSGLRRWDSDLFAAPDVFLRHYLEVEDATHSLSSADFIYRRAALLNVGGFRPELLSWTDTFCHPCNRTEIRGVLHFRTLRSLQVTSRWVFPDCRT